MWHEPGDPEDSVLRAAQLTSVETQTAIPLHEARAHAPDAVQGAKQAA